MTRLLFFYFKDKTHTVSRLLNWRYRVTELAGMVEEREHLTAWLKKELVLYQILVRVMGSWAAWNWTAMEAWKQGKIEVCRRSTKKEAPRVEKYHYLEYSSPATTTARALPRSRSSSGCLRSPCALSVAILRTSWTCHGLEARYLFAQDIFSLFTSRISTYCGQIKLMCIYGK